MRILLVTIFSLIFSTALFADENSPSTEHLVWDKAPLRIILPVGIERMVTFPTPVIFNFDSELLPSEAIEVDNLGGTLYLKANYSFGSVRTDVELSDGRIILLDISAQWEADDSHLSVLIKEDAPTQAGAANAAPQTSGYTELMRFAVQQLYAPTRVLMQPGNIARVPMYITRTVPLYNAGKTTVMPLAQWFDGDFYITALLVRNLLDIELVLSPLNLRGNAWLASTIYPRTELAAHQQVNDSTTLFVITDSPFNTAVLGG